MVDGNNSGFNFEKRVETWARRRLKASHSMTRYLVSGLSISRPYEVDVWIRISRGFFKSDSDLWIECKDRKASIKRRDISHLVSKARDVYEAAENERQEFYFDKLMVVSTSRFDSDAIALANQEGVACVLYNGKTYMLINEWDINYEHKWLKDIKAACN